MSGEAEFKFKTFKSEARIAGNSGTIAKIHNAGVEGFGLKAAGHDLIRGSLTISRTSTPLFFILCRMPTLWP